MNIFNWLFKRNDYKKELLENGSYRLTFLCTTGYRRDIITKSKTLVDMFNNYCNWNDITDEHKRLLNKLKPDGDFLTVVPDLLAPLAGKHKLSAESELFIKQQKAKITSYDEINNNGDYFSLYNYCYYLGANIYVNRHKLTVYITLGNNNQAVIDVDIVHDTDYKSFNEIIPKEDLPTIVRELTLSVISRNEELEEQRRNKFIKSLQG